MRVGFYLKKIADTDTAGVDIESDEGNFSWR